MKKSVSLVVSILLGIAVFMLGDYLASQVYATAHGLAVLFAIGGLIGGVIVAAACHKLLSGPCFKGGRHTWKFVDKGALGGRVYECTNCGERDVSGYHGPIS